MELNDTERKLLIDYYDNKMVQQTCLELCIGLTTYNKYMKELFSKINDYKNTLD
jgi:hypothetical protein